MRFMATLLSLGDGGFGALRTPWFADRWGAGSGRSLATVLSEVAEQRIHRFEAGRIDHRAAVPAHGHQPRHAQAVEMKGESVRREFESAGDLTGGHSLGPGLHKQPEYVGAIILGECG